MNSEKTGETITDEQTSFLSLSGERNPTPAFDQMSVVPQASVSTNPPPLLKGATSCIAPWCHNNRKQLKQEKKPYHWIPKDSSRAKQWFNALGLSSPLQEHICKNITFPIVCGDHFSACDYEGNNSVSNPRPINSFTRKRQLKRDAVPCGGVAKETITKKTLSACIVPGCPNTRYNIHKLSELQQMGPEVSFHHVPRNLSTAQRWFDSLKMPLPENFSTELQKYSYVCSVHFREDDFESRAGTASSLGLEPLKRLLCKDAVPQLEPMKQEVSVLFAATQMLFMFSSSGVRGC